MSDSFSPKPPSEFFSAARRERILEIVRNPFAIAILASIGVHGFLFAALPLLPAAKPKEIDPKQTVGVVELTPLEQLHLPDFATPQVTFPPLSNQTKSSRKSASKKSPTSLFDNSSLYNFPLIAPPPPVTVMPNLKFDFDPSGLTPPKSPTRTNKNNPPSPKPSPTESPKGSSTEKPAEKDDPKVPVRSDKLTPDQVAALLGKGREDLNNRELYTFNAANTTDKDLQTNTESLSVFAEKVSADNIDTDKVLVTDLYPKEACSKVTDERIASVGVIVNPEGKIVDQPKFLRSSGYKGLDNLALDYIGKYPLKAKEKYQGLVFNFFFNPKTVCSANESKPSDDGSKPAS